MTESSIQNIIQYNFLSKENTGLLYKNITINNELTNLTKEQKDKIISILIDCMKQVYKTLDLTKINKTNMLMVKKQYNDIVVKKTAESIKNIKKNNDNIANDRKNEREFNSIKRALPIPGTDRPTSSFANNHGPAPPGTTDYMKNTTTDLNTRLKELEDSRRVVDNRGVPEIPDFLKPVKVGKSSIDMPPASSATPAIFNGFGGYNEMENNFISGSDKSKYNETLSTQDRLKQIEMERNSITSNTPPPQNNQALNVFNQPSQINTFNNVPTSQSNNVTSQSNEYLHKINEMQLIINNLKQENEYLKNEYLKNQKKTCFKSLQLEVAKKDASYNFQFNPISNIVNIKLVAYSFPPPIYNIINETSFNYIINNIEKSIKINPGFYTIDNLLNKLNNDDLNFKLDFTQKVIINSNNMFQIIPNYLTYKLGFVNKEYQLLNTITADRVYDLRPPNKLYFFIKNIYEDQPAGILNFNSSSICELNFKQPINLNNLYLEFYTEDNILYNFNGITYNLSFVIDILE